MRNSYPDSTDLEAFMTGANFPASVINGLFLDVAIDASIEDIEKRTDRKFLADVVDTVRYYDPPTNGSTIYIDDLISLTSVVHQPHGSTAQTLTENTDFVLEPYNAAVKGKPYTHIRFYRRWYDPLCLSNRRSIVVSGKHGYSAQGIPSDVWQAMLVGAAGVCWSQITQATTGGLLSWKESDVEEDYGVTSWSRLSDDWSNTVEKTINKYRKLRL